MPEPSTLFLVRHGKADEPWDYDHDFERPLTRKGKRDVAALAKVLIQEQRVPDCIISSPAFRATQTARRLAVELGLDQEAIQYEAALYPGTEEAYVQCIQTSGSRSVMLVAHNPVIEALVFRLSGGALKRVPTSGCAVFALAADGSAELVFHHFD
jgi:phosphohistidine phosphatase